MGVSMGMSMGVSPPPTRTVLLREFMWGLEQELEEITPDDDEPGNSLIITNPNEFFMQEMEMRAAQLWQGQQIDGTVHDRLGCWVTMGSGSTART